MTAVLNQAKTQEIEFQGATLLTLAGELMLPDGDGPFACVLMMPGSGPTDRDGNQPGLKTDVLKQIAEALAAKGIASFRFDKRPVARYRDQWPKTTDMSVFSDYFSFENHVADVEAAYKTMQAHPKIDAKRCGLLGHSEGGLFASWEAPLLKPQAVALCGTAGDTLVSVLRFQIGQSVAKSSVPKETADAIIASNEECMKSIVETGKLPAKVHPNLAALYNAAALKLLHAYLTIDPTDHLSQYSGPVLVLNGEKDIQVRATVDAPRLFEALLKRPSSKEEMYIVAGASHCLKVLKDDSDPGFEGPVAPSALDKIASWFVENLKPTS
jgi:dienelactone hydrolase